MSKILRCYVANYGLADAWYDGVLMDFRSNDKPIHTIINLDNGGGKTTLLSFLFSVIDPRKDYFLKSRQNPNHKVSDYFSKNGVPGTCLLEWSAPTSSNPHRVYVTGRSVYLRNNQDVEDIMFCYFKESATAIEDFPGPNLGSNEPAMHWDAIQAWLTVRKKEQGFFQNSVQLNWFDRLRADGIVDSAMIRTQMKFSETEGGVDSFVAFKTQEEFLRKFIELSSPDDLMDKVHQGLSEFLVKAKNLPELEKCNAQLLQATEILGTLQKNQASLVTQQTCVARAVEALLGLRGQIYGHCAAVESDFTHIAQSIGQLKADLVAAQDSKVAAEKQERYCAAVRALATYKTSDALFKDKADALVDRKRRIAHIKFLLLERTKTEKIAIRSTIEQEIASILHAQAPLRRALTKAAFYFHRALTQQLSLQKSQLLSEKNALNETILRIDKQKKSLLSLTAELAKSEVAERDAQTQASGLTQKMHALVTQFHSTADRLSHTLQDRINALLHEKERIEGAIQNTKNAKHEAANAIRHEEHDTQSMQNELQRLHAWVRVQQEHAARFQENPILRSIVDGTPDLSMPTLVGNIDDEIAQKQSRISISIAAVSRLSDRVSRLETHQSEQHNDNIDAALEWLHKQGFDQAVSSVQYIASLSPAQRSSYLAKYPLGAGGVFLHPEHLKSLQTLLVTQPLPDLFQHVWVTTFTGDENLPSNGVYLLLTNDIDYDTEKADALLQELRTKLKNMRSEQHAWQEEAKALQRLRFDIEAYQRDYPLDAQAGVSMEIAQKKEDLETSQERQLALNAQLEQAHHDLFEQQQALAQAKRNADEQVAPMEHALRWLVEDYSRLDALAQMAIEAHNQTQAIQISLDTQSHLLRDDEQSLDSCKDRTRTLERLHQDTHLEQGSVQLVESDALDDLDAVQAPSLNVLREEYTRYLGQWQMKSAEQVSANQQMALARCQDNIDSIEKAQRECTVPDAENLNMDAALVTLEQQNFHEQALNVENAEHEDLQLKAKFAHRDYLTYKNENIDPVDANLDASEAALRHEKQKQQVLHLQGSLSSTQQQLSKAEESSSLLREKVHQVKRLKDVFGESVKTIAFETQELVSCETLDLGLWTAARDGALSEYSSSNNELLSLRKSRDTAYSQYDRYRDRHADNPYLKAQHHQDPTLLHDDETLSRLLMELAEISTSMTSDIEKHQSYQDKVVTELATQASTLTLLLEEALSQKVPQGAPLIGGMHVLRVKSSKTPFSSIGDAERLSRVSALIDEYLVNAKTFPAASKDLFAHAIAAIYARPLDFQILKMVENEKERYSFVHQVKNSGAEGVTMAMCLYMTILSVRNKPEKGAKQKDAGVLLIDNPFAKATSNKFWSALHNLADHYRVQFIFLTAVSDPETLRDFQHYIALTKKVDTVTGRRILTNASITFTKKEEPDVADSLV